MANTQRTIRVKFDGDAKDLAAATKVAETAVKNFGDRSGRGFTSSFRKWFSAGGLREMQKAGEFGGSVFGSGLLGALKTPVIGPLLTAALLGTVAVVMPAVGAVAAGGLVGAFGAGLVGLGLVFAAKSETVKVAWSSTLSDMAADMRLLSQPFEATLLAMSGVFRRTFDAFKPYLATAFSRLAGPVEDFSDQVGTALEQLAPVIPPITDAFIALLGAVGPALQTAVGDVAGGMSELARSVAENPEPIADLIRGLGAIVTDALGLINTLSEVNTTFTEMTGGLSLVELALGSVTTSIMILQGAFSGLNAVLGGIDSLIHGANEDIARNGRTMNDAADQVTRAAQAYQQSGTSAGGAAPQVKTLAQRVQESKQAAAEAKQRFDEWITSLFQTQQLALTLSGAQIGLKAAIANATQSVRDNGRTLNLNTAAGRANRTALNGIASAANAQTEATLRAGGSTQTAATRAQQARQSFVNLATQMGLSKAQADALARSLIAIPNVTRSVTIRHITVNGVRQDQGVGGGGHTPTERRARGGPVLPGRTYLVGENGPETLTMGSVGGHITPNDQLGGVNVQVFIGDEPLEARMVRVVRADKRETRRAVGAGALNGAPA